MTTRNLRPACLLVCPAFPGSSKKAGDLRRVQHHYNSAGDTGVSFGYLPKGDPWFGQAMHNWRVVVTQ